MGYFYSLYLLTLQILKTAVCMEGRVVHLLLAAICLKMYNTVFSEALEEACRIPGSEVGREWPNVGSPRRERVDKFLNLSGE